VESIDEEIQGRWGEGSDTHHQRLGLVAVRAIDGHFLHIADAGFHLVPIVVADADGYIDAAVAHAGVFSTATLAKVELGAQRGRLSKARITRQAPTDGSTSPSMLRSGEWVHPPHGKGLISGNAEGIGVRSLAHLLDMSRSLRSARLALHPARRCLQRFPR
jgi:hypothetical protein